LTFSAEVGIFYNNTVLTGCMNEPTAWNYSIAGNLVYEEAALEMNAIAFLG